MQEDYLRLRQKGVTISEIAEEYGFLVSSVIFICYIIISFWVIFFLIHHNLYAVHFILINIIL